MNTFFESIDDFVINWYFENEKMFEKPFQNSLCKARVNLLNSPNEFTEKAYHFTEDIFYNYVYVLFKKKEISLLQEFIKNNFYDENFSNLHQLRNEIDTKFLNYLNSKIDFLKLS